MQKTALLLLSMLTAGTLTAATQELEVKVDGVKSTKGQIVVTVYKDSEGWLKKDQAVESQKIAPSPGTVTARFQLNPGQYAVQIFQDENENGKLDMKWLPPGPKEPWVVSNNAQGTMGPPSYKDAQFELKDAMKLSLSLQQP